MKTKSSHKLSALLNELRDGEYHDGNALGEALQMTRSAIWKMIKKLERYGVEISSIKGRGYALCEPMQLLDETKIRKQITEKKLQISLFESIDSTNAFLKSAQPSKSISFCIAEQQTAGKGRLSRDWYSPFGKNIYCSCRFPFEKDISELAGLSLAVSLAIVRTLKQFGMNEDVQVKWPNDVMHAGRKISGTLIEVLAESHGISHAVIGIGLNINMLIDERRCIAQPWTSMRRVLGHYLDRNEICAALMNHLLEILRHFEKHGFADFVAEWMQEECMNGKTITIKNIRETVTGKVSGINALGHLLLQMPDGEIRAFSSGDTSILKK